MTHRTWDEWRVHGRTVRKGQRAMGRVELPDGRRVAVFTEDQTDPYTHVDTSTLPLLTTDELAAQRREHRNAKRRVARKTVKIDWLPSGNVGKYQGSCIVYYASPKDIEFRASLKQGRARYNFPKRGWWARPATEAQAVRQLDKMRQWDARDIELGPALAKLDADRPALEPPAAPPEHLPASDVRERVDAAIDDTAKTAAALANELGMPRSELVPVLDDLVAAGSVKRANEPQPGNRAIRAVYQRVARAAA